MLNRGVASSSRDIPAPPRDEGDVSTEELIPDDEYGALTTYERGRIQF